MRGMVKEVLRGKGAKTKVRVAGPLSIIIRENFTDTPEVCVIYENTPGQN